MRRCLVAIMGPYPFPVEGGLTTHDCFQRMADTTTSVDAVTLVLPDLVGVVGVTSWRRPEWRPKHRGLVAMRHMASVLAKDGQFDWLFIVENDCYLEADTLDRLIEWNKDIIVPHHSFPEFPLIKSMVYQPQEREGQQGLHHVEWCGYPATLYKMGSFQDVEPMFLGGGEGIDYAHWQQHGLDAWMDLDTPAVNLRLAAAHEVMAYIPGSVRMHRNKETGHRCQGNLDGVPPVKFEGALAAQCDKCAFYVEYLPPKGYRGESLQQLGLLEPAVEPAAAS